MKEKEKLEKEKILRETTKELDEIIDDEHKVDVNEKFLK